MPMTTDQVRHLKKLAHHLKPVVIIGQDGIKPTVIDALNEALDHHELIKVRVNAGDREQRQASIEKLCEATGCELVNAIGHVVSVYRRNPNRSASVLASM